MRQIIPVFKREFLGYFRTPLAYVVMIAFLVVSVGMAFSPFIGFYEVNDASLVTYFKFFPWYYLFFVPAVGMRLWAEEKRSGSIELLFTLPITPVEAVLGKFLAAWAFLSLGVLASFPMAITVAYLGNPDWGVMISSYFGAILMAGAYLGVSSLFSSLTKNQVIAFVYSLLASAFLVFLGLSGFTNMLQGWFGATAADVISNFSFMTHFQAFIKGIIDPKDLMFFFSLMGFTLFLNVVVLER